MVADTSVLAYRSMKAEGRIPPQSFAIMAAMEDGRDYSRSELAEITGLRLASICGRVNELISIGMLEEMPIRKCAITGRGIHPICKV